MSGPATPRSPVNPTRQQLDDLDALLQRMLELPVNQLEEAIAESTPAPKVPTNEPQAPSVVPLAEPAILAADVPAVPVQPSFRQPVPQLEAPDVRQWRLDVPQPEPQPHPTPSTSVAPPREPTPVAAALEPAASIPLALPVESPPASVGTPFTFRPTASPPVVVSPEPWLDSQQGNVDPALPWGIRSFIQVNARFDELASRLGPAGRWARGRTGRALLGWTGLALLATVAVLLFLDWFGWTR